jgi:hypothetical protein
MAERGISSVINKKERSFRCKKDIIHLPLAKNTTKSAPIKIKSKRNSCFRYALIWALFRPINSLATVKFMAVNGKAKRRPTACKALNIP